MVLFTEVSFLLILNVIHDNSSKFRIFWSIRIFLQGTFEQEVLNLMVLSIAKKKTFEKAKKKTSK